MKSLYFSVAFTLLTTLAQAHGDGEARITVEPESQSSYAAGLIHYSFQLFDGTTNKTISEKDLVESHTKLIHLIAYDSSRNQFNHVHPAYDGKVWSADLQLPVNGTYFVWAQGQLIDGTDFSSFAKAQIINGKPEIPTKTLGDHRKNSDQGSILQLSDGKIKAGGMVMLDFKISRDDGKSPIITPYLGALAHVIAVSPDGDELIHVHPMAGNAPDTGLIHATFPTAGDYRIWVQLIDGGVLKTIPLSVTVQK